MDSCRDSKTEIIRRMGILLGSGTSGKTDRTGISAEKENKEIVAAATHEILINLRKKTAGSGAIFLIGGLFPHIFTGLTLIFTAYPSFMQFTSYSGDTSVISARYDK